MIKILLKTNSGFLVIQNDTASNYEGSPDSIVEAINAGSVLKESTDFLLKEDDNIFILE